MKIATANIEYYLDGAPLGDSGSAPLLWLHGFTGSLEEWSPVRKQFARPGLVLDLPGHGRTVVQPYSQPMDFQDWNRNLLQILDVLQLPQVVLCGYSLGGRLALVFALNHPERVAALVLESASPGLATRKERDERMQADVRLAEKIERDFQQFLQQWGDLPFFREQHRRNPQGWQLKQNIRQSASPAGLAYALTHLGIGVQPSCWEQLSQLHLPVLLITGEEDRKFCGIAEQMQSRLPDCQWSAIPHAGHTPHIEQPERFGETVKTFLRSKTGFIHQHEQ